MTLGPVTSGAFTNLIAANFWTGQSSRILNCIVLEKDCIARNTSGLHHPPTFGDAFPDV